MKYEQTCTTKRMSWHTVGSVCQRRVERAINPVQGDGLCIGRHCHCLDSSTEHSHQHFAPRVHNFRNTINTGANTPYRARLTAMSTVNRRVCAGAITSAVEIANRYLCMLRAWGIIPNQLPDPAPGDCISMHVLRALVSGMYAGKLLGVLIQLAWRRTVHGKVPLDPTKLPLCSRSSADAFGHQSLLCILRFLLICLASFSGCSWIFVCAGTLGVRGLTHWVLYLPNAEVQVWWETRAFSLRRWLLPMLTRGRSKSAAKLSPTPAGDELVALQAMRAAASKAAVPVSRTLSEHCGLEMFDDAHTTTTPCEIQVRDGATVHARVIRPRTLASGDAACIVFYHGGYVGAASRQLLSLVAHTLHTPLQRLGVLWRWKS